jgi:hypothetical protein
LCGPELEKDAPAREIAAGDLAEQDADVPATLKNAAQRRGDLAGRERAGRRLVDEGLKLRRSIRVMSTGAWRSFRTACSPPNPTTTTRWRAPDARSSGVVRPRRRP